MHTCTLAQYNTVRSHSLPLTPHYSMNTHTNTHAFFSLPYSPLSPSHSQNVYIFNVYFWPVCPLEVIKHVNVSVCLHFSSSYGRGFFVCATLCCRSHKYASFLKTSNQHKQLCGILHRQRKISNPLFFSSVCLCECMYVCFA